MFEFDGQQYKNASTHQKEWGKNLICQLSLQGNEVILDLGCGDGILTEELSSLVPKGKVIGIDASIGMIKTAQTIKKNNLKFVQKDINTITFTNEFDIIFSNAALHWIKNHHGLLQSSYEALKTDGALLWNFAGEGNCSNFFDVIQRKILEDKYAEFFEHFEWPWFMPSKYEYEKIVSKIGFSDYVITEMNRDRYFSTSDDMIKWIDQPSLVPFLKHIPDRLKDTFRKEVIEEMITKTKQPDGTCFETFRRLQIFAEK